MKSLWEDQFAPVTWTCGFVECSFAEFSNKFTKWRQEIDTKFGARTEHRHFHGSLREALSKLEPLTSPLDRYLLIETHSDWSAIFANGLRINDVFGPVSYLAEVLKCRGLHVHCVPDRSRIRENDRIQTWGAIRFSLYGPDKTDWLNRIRHVGVTNDVDGWQFAAEGTIQPCEEAENYSSRRILDRFTPELLERYCAALGIQLFDGDFYGGRCLASHVRSDAPKGPAMSIAEARSHLYL